MDKHYNVVFKLWKDIHKEIAPQEVTEENAVKFSDTLSDYLLFCKTQSLNSSIRNGNLDGGILFWLASFGCSYHKPSGCRGLSFRHHNKDNAPY